MISRSLGIEAGGEARKNLAAMAERTRTGAEPHVFASNGRPFFDILHESSKNADLVFMGIARPEAGGFEEYYAELRRRTEGLPSTVFVLAAEEIAFREVLLRYDHMMDRME